MSRQLYYVGGPQPVRATPENLSAVMEAIIVFDAHVVQTLHQQISGVLTFFSLVISLEVSNKSKFEGLSGFDLYRPVLKEDTEYEHHS